MGSCCSRCSCCPYCSRYSRCSRSGNCDKEKSNIKDPEAKPEPTQDSVISQLESNIEHERRKSVPLVGQSMTRERFNKAGFSEKNPLKLIEGYQDEPIASLEEA
jgi:hypothetical protein